jgi:tRNA 2-thiouridine synthesizing protein A
MSEIRTIDARGLSCPQPAMMANQAIKKINRGTIEILVDSGTARDNVSRAGKNNGWTVTVEDQHDGSYRILFKK